MATKRTKAGGGGPGRDGAGETHKGLPIVLFPNVKTYRAWLRAHHETGEGLWVKLAKKGSQVASLDYVEARDHAIAFGWIDGLKNAIDDVFFAIRFTPRKKRSKWSQINRKVAERLIADGDMQPAGLREVQAAKADGRWDAAYASSSTIEPPADFLSALEKSPRAARFYETINSANRFAILYRIHDAKRPATRASRIEKFVAMLEAGEVLHP